LIIDQRIRKKYARIKLPLSGRLEGVGYLGGMDISNSEKAQERPVDANDLAPDFVEEIASHKGGENIRLCFTCGTCSAICPMAEVDERYDPRRIIRMAVLGMREEVLSSDFIWLCSDCYSCHEHCPQNVKINALITVIKNIAAKEGHLPSSLKEGIKIIKKQGRMTEISEFENRQRAKYDLEDLTETVPGVSEVIEKCKTLEKVGGEDK